MGKNTLWLLASRVGMQGAMAVFTVLIARRLGSQGYGEYAFMAAAVLLGSAAAAFGTDMHLIREIAGRNDLSGLPAALWIQLGLATLFILAAWTFAPALAQADPAFEHALRVYSLALYPLAFYTVFTTALRGKQRMGAYSLLNTAAALLQVILVWLLVRQGARISALTAVLLGAQAAAALLAGIACTAAIPGFWKEWRPSFEKIPGLLRASAPIALLGLYGIVYQRLTVYMLSGLSGAEATGWYAAPQRVVEASKTVHLAAFAALYPALAQGQAGLAIRPGWGQAVQLSWKLLLAGAAAASILLTILAEPLVHLLFGPEYRESIPALKILAWTLVPYTANTFLCLRYLAGGGERTVARAQLCGIIALAGLNGWWIPVWGLSGACWAVVVAEVAQVGVYGWVRVRGLSPRPASLKRRSLPPGKGERETERWTAFDGEMGERESDRRWIASAGGKGEREAMG